MATAIGKSHSIRDFFTPQAVEPERAVRPGSADRAGTPRPYPNVTLSRPMLKTMHAEVSISAWRERV
jgi:hypothetical protein